MIGATLSTPLLIADLGRPSRFLNMLRVFKPQSPMSVGAWTLAVFGTASAGAVALGAPASRRLAGRRPAARGAGTAPGQPPRTAARPVGDAAAMLSAVTGLVMATYTGVLIGATAIPVWKKHVSVLPIHFGASALASAASLLELLGNKEPALAKLAAAAAAFETFTGWRIEAGGGIESEPLMHGATGITTRIGGMFSGPLPLILRAIGTRNTRTAAAAAALLGSLITRIAWIEAGKASADRSNP